MFTYPVASAILWWTAPRIDALNSGDDELDLEMEQANKSVVGGDFVGEKVSETGADRTPGVGRRDEWSSWRRGRIFALFSLGWGGVAWGEVGWSVLSGGTYRRHVFFLVIQRWVDATCGVRGGMGGFVALFSLGGAVLMYS